MRLVAAAGDDNIPGIALMGDGTGPGQGHDRLDGERHKSTPLVGSRFTRAICEPWTDCSVIHGD